MRDCRIDLSDIPLAPICADYTSYLRETGNGEIDCASAGMFGLAYLVERKAWGMMPNEEEPEEPDELDRPDIPEAVRFAPVIGLLAEWRAERERLFFRGVEIAPGHYELPRDLSGIETGHLVEAFRRLLERARPDPLSAVNLRRVSMSDLIKRAKNILRLHDGVQFDALLPLDFTRLDVVWTFLAMLEMVRLGLCRVTIKEGSIWLWEP